MFRGITLLQAGTPDDFYQHQVGFPIEIIPLADPSALHAGNYLPVLGRTNRNGTISVPITKAGKWRLHSLKMERCSEPAVADGESFWASLTFETP